MDRNHVLYSFSNAVFHVALHPEGVDRNLSALVNRIGKVVALHPEGVDRNMYKFFIVSRLLVALHPEGVDRNTF